MQRISSLPLGTSTPPPFQGIQCKSPSPFMARFGITYNSFHRSTSGTSIPKGAIAGIVVGIFLGVIVFPVLALALWRHRRRRGEEGDTFIEPSIHKGFDVTEDLDIQPRSLGPPTASPVSEVSLDLVPVTIPQVAHSWSGHSPPTFPRSPTTSSSPSPTRHLRDSSGRGVIHSPDAVDQYLSVQIRSPTQPSPEYSPLPGLVRRSSVPKPSGPRPQSYRANTDDPRASVFMPPVRIATEPNPKGKGPQEPQEPQEPPELEMEQVNEGGRMTTYSFLDMNSSSATPSTIDGQWRNSIQPIPHINFDSPRHSLITRTNSTSSRRDIDRRRESGSSKPLSLSVVIQQPPTLKPPPSAEPHPYSRHRAVERASFAESIPVSMSEVSEIRFSNPGEISSEPSPPLPSGSNARTLTQLPPMNPTPTTSSIYQKLFGVQQGEATPDGLLAKKRPIHRKALSASTFSTLARM